jgi:hypothetical protein
MNFFPFLQARTPDRKVLLPSLFISGNFRPTWRKVRAIKGWLSIFESYLLWWSASYSKAGNHAVEIGSYEGRSTVAIARGLPAGSLLFAVDPHTGDRSEVDRGEVVDTFLKFTENTGKLKNIIPIRESSVAAAASFTNSGIDFIFIDGWHSESAVDQDINAWLPFCYEEFTIIFDDWQQVEVANGILRNIHKLPPLLGVVGKDLIFSSNKNLLKSRLAKKIKTVAPQSGITQFLSN